MCPCFIDRFASSLLVSLPTPHSPLLLLFLACICHPVQFNLAVHQRGPLPMSLWDGLLWPAMGWDVRRCSPPRRDSYLSNVPPSRQVDTGGQKVDKRAWQSSSTMWTNVRFCTSHVPASPSYTGDTKQRSKWVYWDEDLRPFGVHTDEKWTNRKNTWSQYACDVFAPPTLVHIEDKSI